MRWPERLYRVLLRCYPAEFRDEYASEMAQTFRDRSSAQTPLRLWRDLVTDVAVTAPREHAQVLLNDLRYTARMMRKAPAFTAAVVLTVALAIGANTAIFSFVYAVMLRSLPFAEPQRLVQVAEKNDTLHLPNFGASVLNYLSWAEQTKTLERLGAMGFASFNMSGQGDPEQFTGSPISPSLVPLLGLQPVAGRAFRDGEDKPGSAPVAMISEGLWKRRFGREPSLVGRSLRLNGIDYTVVGIAPAALGLLTGGDIWIPLTIDPGRENRLNHVIQVFGRLKPGVDVTEAQAEMDTVASRVGHQYPEVKDWGIHLVTMSDTFVSAQLRAGLLVLLGAVACVLFIACANIANLLLARAASRQKEIAIRTAMGASRTRLLRQLLVESVALSLIGGALGILAAVWAVGAINGALPPNFLPVPDVGVDSTVLLFAAGMTLVTGVLFGIAPAWHGAKADLNAMLKQSAPAAGGGSRPLLRNGLAAAELALATVLLVGAGLLVQSLLELQRVRLGFQPDGLMTFQLSLPAAKYPGDKAPAFYRELLESLRTAPGIRDAAISSGLPFGAGNYTTTPIQTVGKSVLPAGTAVPIDWRIVSPGFFRTLEIPLLRGRDFTDADAPPAPPVIIVSQRTAQTFWGADDPIGRELRQAKDTKGRIVVGVVGDVRSTALNRESPTQYYPSPRGVWPLMDVVVRTSGTPESILPALRQKVRAIDPQVPLANVRPMAEWLANNAAQPRLNATLLAIFAGVALLIAAVGTYGVLAYSVSQRTREIGLRIALGAQRGRVLRLVVHGGMTMALAGIGIGVACALGVSRVLATLVFGVPVRDPATFITVTLILTIVALAACLVPAVRASRVDPMVSLREE
jgi:putative ABC transport system permease protein